MKYVIRKDIRLCGWNKLPYAYRDESNGNVQLLNKAEFSLLLKFTGKTDIDFSSLDEQERRFAEGLLKIGVISEATGGETYEPPYRFYPNMFKSEAHWSVTGRCNYRCRHCMVSAPSGTSGELSHEQCMDIIAQLSECGVQKVSLTGGEPLVRSDILELIDEIMRRGMFISTIYSNGKLITREFLRALKDRGIHPGFQISFDGVGWHDWMRGVQGAEEVAFDCFRLLKENGFKFSCAMCVFKENLSSIRETVKALGLAGCSALKIQVSAPEGEWLEQKEHYLSYDEAFAGYLDYIPQFYEDGCPIDLQIENFFIYVKESGRYLIPAESFCSERALDFTPPCKVVHNNMYISPKGSVLPCMSFAGSAIEDRMPTVFEKPLRQILSDSEYTELLDKRLKYVLEKDPECSDCSFRLKCCGGCRAMAMQNSVDDYFARDTITCKIFREDWIHRIDAVAGQFWKKGFDPEAKDSIM